MVTVGIGCTKTGTEETLDAFYPRYDGRLVRKVTVTATDEAPEYGHFSLFPCHGLPHATILGVLWTGLGGRSRLDCRVF